MNPVADFLRLFSGMKAWPSYDCYTQPTTTTTAPNPHFPCLKCILQILPHAPCRGDSGGWSLFPRLTEPQPGTFEDMKLEREGLGLFGSLALE